MDTLLREIRFFFYRWAYNMRNQKALRASFALQIIGMMLNNISFFIIWVMFSQKIGVLNGWGAIQTFGMLGMSMMSFGLVHTLFGTPGHLHEVVPNGQFDAYLAKPKNLYTRIMNSDAAPMALGDLLQGGISILIYFWITHACLDDILLFLVMIPPAMFVQASFGMVCDCLVFWLPQTPVIGSALRDLIVLPTTQPISMVRGGLRLVYLTVIPALLVAGLPIEVVTYHKFELIAIAYAVSLSWLALSIWILNVSIKRYESGNVIG